MAAAAPVAAVASTLENDSGFAMIFRFGVIPAFLFSGAFFPVSNLPVVLEWLARLTPLFHGVELARMAALGTWDGSAWVHVGYLVALAALGGWLAVRRLTARLVA